MCGAYGFTARDAERVYDRFEIINTLPDFKPRYNIRPGQLNPIITAHSPKQISRMFWGLINQETENFHKHTGKRLSTINATSEKVATSKVYRDAFLNRRCLIPATGFFEPDKVHYEKPPYPWHYFQLKSKDIFSFAGIYDTYKNPETGKEITSYSLLTCEPNEIVGEWHHRMPVIFQNREDEDFWINLDNNGDVERLKALLVPYPSDKMEQWPVGPDARSPRNDYPEVMEPLTA